MNATYTILTPEHRHRRRFARTSWLAAMGTLAISLPLAIGVSFYILAGNDDDSDQDYGASATTAELALPDLPASGREAITPPVEVAEASAPEAVAISEAEESPPTVVPADDPRRRVVRLEWGDTLIGLLLEAAVPEAQAHDAMAALRTVYDPRDVQAGEEVVLRYGDNGDFTGFEFEPAADRAIRVERNGDDFKAASVVRPLSHNVMAAAVEIDGSLYESGIKAGIPASTMSDLVKALSYNVDFQRDIKAGDSFKVLYEVMRNPEGSLVRTGQILYAEVKLQGRVVPVYRYRYSDGRIDFYDRQGNSVRKALLRTPVNAARMSSGFGMRRHPVLGYTRMHKGVDFAAPIGTPIYASGDGIVVERGVKNGYGNYIRIRHNSTLQTAYAHMSRFNPSVTRGSRVRQGQVIGYVGMSGVATGPHLHYETLVNNVQVSPLSIANMNTGEPLRGANLDHLRGIIHAIDEQFSTLRQGVAVDAAFNATTGDPIRQSASLTTTLPAGAQAKRVSN